MLIQSMYKLRNLNALIQKNKALIEKSRRVYLNIARLAKNSSKNWTPAEHANIQSELRHALAQTKNLQTKMKTLERIRPTASAVTLQSAWKGYTARRNTAGSRKPQVPHRSNYNRRLKRSHRPQNLPA